MSTHLNSTDSLPIVAAFDFDGTLTYRDTLIPFLIYTCGYLKTWSQLILSLPIFIKYLGGLVSRQTVKEELLIGLIATLPLTELKKKGEEFAKRVIFKLLKPEAMKKFQWHRQQGHCCILISANLHVYLSPWAEMEQFNYVICSELQVDEKGLLTGVLEGENCRGQVKVDRLLKLMGARHHFILYAYGDSEGDRQLLELADYPFYCKFY